MAAKAHTVTGLTSLWDTPYWRRKDFRHVCKTILKSDYWLFKHVRPSVSAEQFGSRCKDFRV